MQWLIYVIIAIVVFFVLLRIAGHFATWLIEKSDWHDRF